MEPDLKAFVLLLLTKKYWKPLKKKNIFKIVYQIQV